MRTISEAGARDSTQFFSLTANEKLFQLGELDFDVSLGPIDKIGPDRLLLGEGILFGRLAYEEA